MTHLENMTAEERVKAWGYDPLARLKYIGATEKSFPYPYNGHTYQGRFEFYYKHETGAIDVNHFGCNGRIFTGKELPDGKVTFNPPQGYPSAETFVGEFTILRDKFLKKLNEEVFE